MSIRKFLDLPAISSCMLGSNPVMIICDKEAGWSGLLQSCWTIIEEGLALDPRLSGPESWVSPNVPIDGI